jgi:hypothetical protein
MKTYIVSWIKSYNAEVTVEANSRQEAIDLAQKLPSNDSGIEVTFLDNDFYQAEEVTY